MRLLTRMILWFIGCLVLAGGVLVIVSGIELVRAAGRFTLTDFILMSGGLFLCLVGLRIIVGFRQKRTEDDAQEKDEPTW